MNLRKAAHHARQALGRDDAVRLSGGTVAPFPSCEVDTDVADFERRAEAAIRSGDGATCDAVGHPGALLPDLLYEGWTGPGATGCGPCTSRSCGSAGVGRLVEIDPSDEQAHRELMRAALAGGNRHAAIRWSGRARCSTRHSPSAASPMSGSTSWTASTGRG